MELEPPGAAFFTLEPEPTQEGRDGVGSGTLAIWSRSRPKSGGFATLILSLVTFPLVSSQASIVWTQVTVVHDCYSSVF